MLYVSFLFTLPKVAPLHPGFSLSIFFCPSPLPLGGSTVLSYSRTSGESNHHRQSVSDTRVPRYQLHHEDDYFLYLFFRRKITEIDRAVILSEVVRLEPYPPQFLIWTRSPAPLQTMIEKNKIMSLCSICTLIFVSGGKGGMPGLSHALVPAQESKRWSFGRLLLLPVIQKSLFLGPKKSKKIRHANTGFPSSRCLRRMLFVLKYFFPSNARWLSPGRLSSRKDNCILQIHRINAVATSVMTTMCIQKCCLC